MLADVPDAERQASPTRARAADDRRSGFDDEGSGVKRAWIAIAALGAYSAPGSAQIATSSADTQDGKDRHAFIAGATELKRIGACIVGKNRAQANAFLNSRPESDDEQRIGSALMKIAETCMSLRYNAMRMQFSELRGAVAEALYHDAFESSDWSSTKHDMQPLPVVWLNKPLSNSDRVALISQDFAQCVAAQDPAAVVAVLNTVPRSQEERAAVNKLVPLFSACLAKGATFHMDMASIRSLLAQALYREAAIWKPMPSQAAALAAPGSK